jgi:O-antigen ligase
MNLQQADKYVARALMAGFFLPPKGQSAVIMAYAVYMLVRSKVFQKPVDWKGLGWAALLGSGWLICMAAFPFTPTALRPVLHGICERKTALFLAPAIFSLIDWRLLQTTLAERIYFVYGAVLAGCITNLLFLVHELSLAPGHAPPGHVAYRQYLESVSGMHPTYLGMYLAFAVALLFTTAGPMKPIFKYAMLASLLFFSFCTLAKSPTLALLLILAMETWKRRHRILQQAVALVAMVALLAVSFAVVPFFRQRLAELFTVSDGASASNAHANSVTERQVVWHTDLAVLHQDGVMLKGVGPGGLQQRLNQVYFWRSLHDGANFGYFDPHNEYMWQWLSFGIAGVFLLVMVFGIHIFTAIKTHSHPYAYLLLILTITCFTESILARQYGIMLCAVMGGLWFFGERRDKAIV